MGKIWKEATNYLHLARNYVYFVIGLYFLSYFISFFFPSYFSFFNLFLQGFGEKVQSLNTFEFVLFIAWNNIANAFLVIVSGLFFGVVPLIHSVSNGAIFGYVTASTLNATGSFSSIWRFIPHGIFELAAVFIALGLGVRLGFGFVKNYFYVYRGSKSMKILGGIAFAFALFGIGALSYVATSETFRGFFGLLGLRLFFFIPLVLLFLIFNKKLRKLNKKVFHERFYISLKVFLVIVVPLLIIASIIEGFVLFYLR